MEIHIVHGYQPVPINKKDLATVKQAVREGKYDLVDWTMHDCWQLLAMSKILLKQGARITAQQNLFFTATLATIKIDACAYEKRRESQDRIATYLAAGGNVNQQDNLGHTLLHKAVIAIKPEDVESLLMNGASLDIKDRDGKTPFQLIIDMINLKSDALANIDKQWKDICHLFLSYGASLQPEKEKDFMSMGINQRLAEHEWQARNHRTLGDLAIRNKELATEQQSLREFTGTLINTVTGDMRRIDTTIGAITSSQQVHSTQLLALTDAVQADFTRQGRFIDDINAQLNEQQQVIAAMNAQLIRQQEMIGYLCMVNQTMQVTLPGLERPRLTNQPLSLESPPQAGGISFFNASSKNDLVQVPRTEWEALKHKVALLEHEKSSHNDRLKLIEDEIKLINATENRSNATGLSL